MLTLNTLNCQQEVSTFGFRGEALSSLCALASISITTRTANTNPAQRLSYDHTGTLVGTTPTARAVGTTVAVKDLFKTLPVRHKVHEGAADHCYCPTLHVWVALPCTLLVALVPWTDASPSADGHDPTP